MWFERVIADEDYVNAEDFFNLGKANRVGWEHYPDEDGEITYILYVSYDDSDAKHYLFKTRSEKEYKHAAKVIRRALYEGDRSDTPILSCDDLRLRM